MPTMAPAESLFCRSRGWNWYAARHVLPWALADAPSSGRVLELGAGSGAMAERLLDRSPALSLTATDVDPRMVAAAASRLERFGGRAQAARADASSLPPAYAAGFDVVCSFLMLHHTLDIPGALRGAAGALRPGGRLIGYDLVDTALARAVHIVDRSPFDLTTAKELSDRLDNNDWHQVTVEASAGGYLVRFSALRAGDSDLTSH